MTEPNREQPPSHPGAGGVPEPGAGLAAYLADLEDELDIEDASAALRKGGRLIPLEELEAELTA